MSSSYNLLHGRAHTLIRKEKILRYHFRIQQDDPAMLMGHTKMARDTLRLVKINFPGFSGEEDTTN
ncbi:hypothetical protein WN944_003474 [Citrus x changshan-huyou]|uniref:Uncharacterized protein n=1 Tax=Citrus x changshan-huyou TaxID=2935761 RepID=A0AAP0QL70_9ROSI